MAVSSYKYGRPLSYLYSQLETFVNRGPYLVGIGNTITPWVVEGSPPDIDMSLSIQSELKIYLPTLRVLAVIPYPTEEEETIEVGGEYYMPIDSSYESIEEGGATRALLEIKLSHSDLVGVNHYRSLGIYDELELTDVGAARLASGLSLQPDDVEEARLLFLSNISPVMVQPPTVEFINILMPV